MKTSGSMDWDIGLEDSLTTFVNQAPEQTLHILRLALVEGGSKDQWVYMRYMNKLEEPLKALYMNPLTRDETYKLINDLLPLGNGRFWSLKDIVS
jgi:hypothetical protein